MKRIIFKALCNSIVGWLIGVLFNYKIPDLRWRNFRFKVDKNFVRSQQIASIFWGFYESAEIRLIEKYLKGNRDVLELGGSIGIVSSHIVSKLIDARRLITVEANPNLIELITTNLRNHSRGEGIFEVENCALAYFKDSITFLASENNTESRVISDSESGKSHVSVRACTLDYLVEKNNLSDFVLVCDIEGSEIEFLLHEKKALQKCNQLFIELHETGFEGVKYHVKDLMELIKTKHQFNLVEQQGFVFFFSK